MASIEPRANGAYRIRWRLDGRRDGKWQSVTTNSDTRAEHVKSFVELRGHRITGTEVSRLMFGTDATSDTPTLAGWVQTWHKQKDEDGQVQPDTLARYLQNINRWIVPRLGDYRLDAITTDVIIDWLAWLKVQNGGHRRPLSADTIRHQHTMIHQLLGAAVPRWLAANPVARPAGSRKGTPGLPKRVRYEATFLDPDEAALILRHAEPAIRDIADLALRTGMRLGELLVLRPMDVDLSDDNPVLHVKRAVKADGTIGTPKSQRSRRTISLSPETVKLLKRLGDGKPRTALLFPTPEGGMWDGNNLVRRHWKKAVAAARRCPNHMPPVPPKSRRGPERGYRITEVSDCPCPGRLHKVPRFHDTRHSHAAWLIALKEDIFTISRRLGHESITTTLDTYGHLLPRGDGGRLAALDELAG
jgi:integrase